MSYDTHAKDWHLLQARQRNNLAHRYLEKPAMMELLSDTLRARVLLLGCGSGEEIEWLRGREGFEIISLHGIDESAGLVDYAKLNYPEYTFESGRLEDWVPTGEYDLVYSSLTLHYIEDWESVLAKIYKVLRPGGEVVFSVQHPIKWGAETRRSKQKNSFVMGYEKYKQATGDDSTHRVWGDYLTSRYIDDTLFGKIPIRHYHRPLSEMVASIMRSDLELAQMVEPVPREESRRTHPDFYEVYRKIPLFVLFKLRKG